MKIEQLSIKNFKVFRNVEMRDIPNFCVIIGANGSGKSTLFRVFGFLREALNSNVHNALVSEGGSKGFSEVRSRGSTGNIEIEIKFRAKQGSTKKDNPLITYFLSITEENRQAVVEKEILKYRRGQRGRPWEFLNFGKGEGFAVTDELNDDVASEDKLNREQQKLKSPSILAIKGLAQFKNFPAVMALGNLIERWHLSDIHISKARQERQAGFAEHLSREGDNLSLVIDYLYQNHPTVMDKIIDSMKHRIPGISDISAKTIETGQVLLQISDSSFNKEPFLVRYVSDGTVKMLAYLVLLNDPDPHPLLCIEEPENQLYPKLLTELAEEFRQYAQKGEQVFVSTHSPDFLNAVWLDEVFMLVKKDGHTTISKAEDNDQIAEYMGSGDKMGWLWNEGLFEGIDP